MNTYSICGGAIPLRMYKLELVSRSVVPVSSLEEHLLGTVIDVLHREHPDLVNLLLLPPDLIPLVLVVEWPNLVKTLILYLPEKGKMYMYYDLLQMKQAVPVVRSRMLRRRYPIFLLPWPQPTYECVIFPSDLFDRLRELLSRLSRGHTVLTDEDLDLIYRVSVPPRHCLHVWRRGTMLGIPMISDLLYIYFIRDRNVPFDYVKMSFLPKAEYYYDLPSSLSRTMFIFPASRPSPFIISGLSPRGISELVSPRLVSREINRQVYPTLETLGEVTKLRSFPKGFIRSFFKSVLFGRYLEDRWRLPLLYALSQASGESNLSILLIPLKEGKEIDMFDEARLLKRLLDLLQIGNMAVNESPTSGLSDIEERVETILRPQLSASSISHVLTKGIGYMSKVRIQSDIDVKVPVKAELFYSEKPLLDDKDLRLILVAGTGRVVTGGTSPITHSMLWPSFAVYSRDVDEGKVINALLELLSWCPLVS